MKYHVAASTGGGKCNLNPQGRWMGYLTYWKTMSSSELAKLFVWPFARIRNP